MAPSSKARPPDPLIRAFKAIGSPTDISVLMIEDGFDAVLVRVLNAWEKSRSTWSMPGKAMPDDGRPTADAWDWLVSGWHLDVAGVAQGANISRETARERLGTLVQARLIFPDGTMSEHARKAMTAAVQARLLAATRKKGGKKRGDDGEHAN